MSLNMKPSSTAEIETQIARYALHFDAVKDKDVEWKIRAPHFIPPFIELLDKHARVPTQTEYVNYYMQTRGAAVQTEFARFADEERDHKYRALIARLERAYPSFVRDLYLLALLRENNVAAEYDVQQDVEGGVDLLVTHNGQTAQLHAYLDSPRGQRGRARKETRHQYTGKHVDLALKRDEMKRVGAFWLPTLEHVERIRRELELDADERRHPHSLAPPARAGVRAVQV